MTNKKRVFEEDQSDYRQQKEPVQLSLFLTLDGFEGPIDVLLSLARNQKVDLIHISILELTEQYLLFVQQAQSLNLEIAADYLVMAAWLAYLKSRLLLPKTEKEDELSPGEMAEALRFQLQRLESMRSSGARLMSLPQIGVDRFKRGMPVSISNKAYPVYDLTLFELLKFYGNIHLRGQNSSLQIAATRLFSVDEAVERLRRMIKKIPDWQVLISYLPSGLHSALLARSAVASTFMASLELAKDGQLELRQETSFGPIYIRNRD